MKIFACFAKTYEGGIGGEPGNEAHGGYTFCGLAAAALAGAAQALDLDSLARWASSCQVISNTARLRGAHACTHPTADVKWPVRCLSCADAELLQALARRLTNPSHSCCCRRSGHPALQGTIEGGFMGRTNKLVDGCYSYWQGGLFPLLESLRLQLPSSAAAGTAGTAQAANAPSAAASAADGSQPQAPLPAQQAASAAAGPAAWQRSSTNRRITVPPLPPLSGRSMLQHAADDVAALQALDVKRRSPAAPSADVTEASAALCIVGPAMHLAAECKHIGCKLAGGTELYSSDRIALCKARGGMAVQAGIRAEDFAAAAQSCATTLAMRWGCAASDRQEAPASAAAAGSMPAASADTQANSSDSSSTTCGHSAADEGYCMSCRPSPAGSTGSKSPPLYDVEALQLWLLQCCQAVSCASRLQLAISSPLRLHEASILSCCCFTAATGAD
jgi:Prenyltransferase and squalene oxidase repeat